MTGVQTCALPIFRVLKNYPRVPQLRRPAQIVLGLIVVQLAFGFGAYLTRVQWGKDAPQPMTLMVATTVAHVAVGALVLATTAVLALEVRRHMAPSSKQAAAPERTESRQAVMA